MHSSVSNESPALTKNECGNTKAEFKDREKELLKHEITKSLSNVEFSCFKSTSITKQDNCDNVMSNEKLKTPIKTKYTSGLSTDKVPVVQFCTPRNLKANIPATNTKLNILSTRTPVKRYFSDHTLSQTTPECFNTVQMETPCNKMDDIIVGEQTMYEGESSNLTVGIRIRPLNSK